MKLEEKKSATSETESATNKVLMMKVLTEIVLNEFQPPVPGAGASVLERSFLTDCVISCFFVRVFVVRTFCRGAQILLLIFTFLLEKQIFDDRHLTIFFVFAIIEL